MSTPRGAVLHPAFYSTQLGYSKPHYVIPCYFVSVILTFGRIASKSMWPKFDPSKARKHIKNVLDRDISFKVVAGLALLWKDGLDGVGM